MQNKETGEENWSKYYDDNDDIGMFALKVYVRLIIYSKLMKKL
jgi:hypothetical protein